MKSNKPAPSFQLNTEEWYTQDGIEAVVFAIMQSFVSSTNSMAGYLEEQADAKPDMALSKQIMRTSKSQLQNVKLLDQLYRLINLKNLYVQNIHIEQLLKKVSSISDVHLSSQSTYTSSLVSVDEEAFGQCVLAIISACNSSKSFSTLSRRRDNYLVISIFSKKNQWVSLGVHNAIRSFQLKTGIQKRYQLDELVATYALTVLHCLGVAVSSRCVQKQDRLYLHIPISQQLNVFDTQLVSE